MAASDRSALDDPAIECTTPAFEDDIDCPAPTSGGRPDADEAAPTLPMYPPRLGPLDSEAADASILEPAAKLTLPSSSPLAAVWIGGSNDAAAAAVLMPPLGWATNDCGADPDSTDVGEFRSGAETAEEMNFFDIFLPRRLLESVERLKTREPHGYVCENIYF